MLHPRPATLPARRTCRRFLPPPHPIPPPSEPGLEVRPRPGRRRWRPSWDSSSRWEAPRPGVCGCLIAAWPWAKLPSPLRAPHFPSPLLGGGGAVRAPWPGPGETFAGGEGCLSAQARLPLPSLPPSAPRTPPRPHGRIPRRTCGARRSRESNGERDRTGTGTGTGARNPAGI